MEAKWYCLIQVYNPAQPAEQQISLEKIELHAENEEAAASEAQALFDLRCVHGRIPAPDGLLYPRSLQIVYARKLDDATTRPQLVLRENEYLVDVDYNIPLEEAIRRGRYDDLDPRITARHFPGLPIEPARKVIRLIDMGYRAPTGEILGEIEEAGLQPATIWELLALGAQHPLEQRTRVIVALGTFWNTMFRRRVPLLGHSDVRRFWRDHDFLTGRYVAAEDMSRRKWLTERWSRGCVFAAVRPAEAVRP